MQFGLLPSISLNLLKSINDSFIKIETFNMDDLLYDVINIILVSIFWQKQESKEKLNLNIFILYYLLKLNVVLYKINKKYTI